MEIYEIPLPDRAQGRLYLSNMPGVEEPWPEARERLGSLAIDELVCLLPREQWELLSPDYARSALAGDTPANSVNIEMPARGFPPELADFFKKTDQLAESLLRGKNVLVHCDTGRGRSGTLCIAILLRLGVDQLDAFSRLADAASGIETSEQETLIETVAKLHRDVVTLELEP